jgi:nicotinamide riboside kinase
MLISFTGAQSTGKTTLLNYLSERNPDIKFIPEVTRLVKRLYDLPINEAGNVMTQMMIMAEHVKNAFAVEHKDTNVILDRCSVDGLIYTHWLCDQGLDMSAYSFARTVYENTVSKYDVIFYTSPEDVVLEDDGERSINTKFREDIIDLFHKHFKHPQSNLVILKGSVEDRLQTIKKTLKEKGLDINI